MAMRLSDLTPGQSALVCHLDTKGGMRRRFLDIGLAAGTWVECVGRSPGGDPAAYLIRGTVTAIRARDADTVQVTV